MLYEYKCGECDHQFTMVLSMNKRNNPLKELCPSCGKISIHRVYSIGGTMDGEIFKADKRMEQSGVQSALERIRDNHPNSNMKWKG